MGRMWVAHVPQPRMFENNGCEANLPRVTAPRYVATRKHLPVPELLEPHFLGFPFFSLEKVHKRLRVARNATRLPMRSPESLRSIYSQRKLTALSYKQHSTVIQINLPCHLLERHRSDLTCLVKLRTTR